VYRATVIVAAAKNSPGATASSGALGALGGLGSLVGIGLGESRIREDLAVLTSRGFTDKFFDKMHVLPALYEKNWDAEKGDWKSIDEQSAWQRFVNSIQVLRTRVLAVVTRDEGAQATLDSLGNAGPSRERAYLRFNQIRSVDYDLRTEIVTVSVDWRDPVLAAKWANGIVDLLNEELRQRAIEESTKKLQYLERQAQTADIVGVRNALFQLIEQEQKVLMVANTVDEYSLHVLDRAIVPEQRLRPRRSMMVLFGIFFGGMLGVSYVIARAFVYWQRPDAVDAESA
jgi:uncharacterized protein involved in exopolysaccharide biosynthesis